MKKMILVWMTLLLTSLACRFSATPAVEPVETAVEPVETPPAPAAPTQASPTLIVSPLPTTVVYKTIAGVDPDLLSLDIHAPANAANALLESGQVTGNVVLVAPDLDA